MIKNTCWNNFLEIFFVLERIQNIVKVQGDKQANKQKKKIVLKINFKFNTIFIIFLHFKESSKISFSWMCHSNFIIYMICQWCSNIISTCYLYLWDAFFKNWFYLVSNDSFFHKTTFSDKINFSFFCSIIMDHLENCSDIIWWFSCISNNKFAKEIIHSWIINQTILLLKGYLNFFLLSKEKSVLFMMKMIKHVQRLYSQFIQIWFQWKSWCMIQT